MDNNNILTFLLGVAITILCFAISIDETYVKIKTDELTNTKYINYQNTIYTLIPYKKITKE